MKRFSTLSITFLILGVLLFALNWAIEGFYEPIVLSGYLSFLVGIVFSFIAITKREDGSLKFISLISFFVMMFLITYFDPFQVIRMITWIKNVY
ncbi:hypothetical protein [Bacillus sp. Brlt_9]|uniref:hypothetical protein n=1 Tax=Bacillus sp. Brlt_9 TaxID=3110916 RepID=UPI003F7C3ACC